MEKKIFYTLQQRKGVKGVRKECGYELEIATRKFYGYVSADQTVYIIDPRNGIAIMSCDTALICDDEILRGEKEIECIKYAAKRVIEKDIFERLKEKENGSRGSHEQTAEELSFLKDRFGRGLGLLPHPGLAAARSLCDLCLV